jgi:hypothetical protein
VPELEEELRRVLNDPRLALPGWPDAAARVRTGMRARRRRSLIVIISAGLAALAAALVAAVAPLGQPTLTPPGDVVAWQDIPPAERPEPTLSPRPVTTECRRADLRFDGVQQDGAGGTLFHLVQVTNTGTQACTLSGRPGLKGWHGGRVQTLPKPGAALHLLPYPDQVPATIEPGEVGELSIETYGGCLDGRKQTTYTSVTLVLPDGEMPLRDSVDTTCGLNMGPWHRLRPVAGAVDEPLAVLRLEIAPPEPVRRGESLHFVVTVANPGDEPVALDPCPNYQTRIDDAPVKAVGVHELHCAVRAIPGHSSVRFAMELPIPDYTTFTGSATLVWILGDSTDRAPSARVPVTIL